MEQPIVRKREPTDPGDGSRHYSTRSTTSSGKPKKMVARFKPLPYSEQDLHNGVKPPSKHQTCTIESRALDAELELHSTDDNPFNRRGFKYKACAPNPLFPSLMYGTTDMPPYAVRLSYFDRSQATFVDDSMRALTSDQGWRSSRTNVGIREGCYYTEFKIVRANDSDVSGHVRVGLARKEASIEAPVGFDGYGYGLRDKTGEKLHLSRPTPFLPGGFTSGDVIGMLVELPSLDVQRRISELQIRKQVKSNPLAGQNAQALADVAVESVYCTETVRDQIPIRYKNQLYFEQYEYTPTTAIEHLLNPVTVFGEKAIPDKDKFKPAVLPESKVTFYKNGERVGVAFQELYAFLPPNSEASQNPAIAAQKKAKKPANDGDLMAVVFDDGSLGYYPMVSTYRNGCAEINAGPDFEKLPVDVAQLMASGKVAALADRYHDKVAEDVVLDILDEVESQYLDALEQDV